MEIINKYRIVFWIVMITGIVGNSGFTQESPKSNLRSEQKVSSPKPALPRVMRNILTWPKGSMADVKKMIAANANIVHTFPAAPGMKGFRPPLAIQEWLEKMWGNELDQLHEAGVRVFASQASTGFVSELFVKYELNPELYYARGAQGNNPMMLGGSYGKDYMTSCYNNPHWIELLILVFLR